jgi:hypothetical protein
VTKQDEQYVEDWITARQMMLNHKSPGLIVRHLSRMLDRAAFKPKQTGASQ